MYVRKSVNSQVHNHVVCMLDCLEALPMELLPMAVCDFFRLLFFIALLVLVHILAIFYSFLRHANSTRGPSIMGVS